MTALASHHARNNMITGQIITGDVQDEAILAALGKVERQLFVPDAFRNAAYIDENIAFGNGRYLLEPLVFARMLKYAAIAKHETVLDVGSLTGYSAAVISELAQKVVALEEDSNFSSHAKTLLQSYANVELCESALIQGVSARAPYDVILIEGAVEFVPQVFSDQLREGGRLLTIEHVAASKTAQAGLGKLVEYRKIKNAFYKTVLHDASAPVIAGFKQPKTFVF